MDVVKPENTAALGEVVRQTDRPLFPMGGGTLLDLGNPPLGPGRVVDCRALDAVIDYPARDMTITVQAGITIARLQEILATEKQRLPIDVPQPERATLGGTLAANVSGPRRLGYGTLRDYVIGISAINDEGQEFKAGGRVVKNVAGYDLCKLLVGSLGTLGIITQVTLKLRPTAESSRLVLLPVASAKAAESLERVHASRTRPVAVDLVERSSLAGVGSSKEDWVLAVGYEGNAETVAWQARQLEEEWKGELTALDDEASRPVWRQLIEPDARLEAICRFKANLLPSAVAGCCLEARKAGWLLQAQASSGIVWGHARSGLTLDQAAAMLTPWRATAKRAQGSVVVTRCPSEWKKSLDVWGPPPEGAWLMREVKKKFDPRGIFNPGRFVAGI
jgi:glycolate oxidase FAD binding subunit